MKELRYLYELLDEIKYGNFKHNSKKPMDVEERKLRSRIRKKCRIYIYELALAQLCGLIPDKKMKKAGINDISSAIEFISSRFTTKVEIPRPLINYVYFIRLRKSPYYKIAEHVLKELEKQFIRARQEIVYTINKEFIFTLMEKIEKKIKKDEDITKLTLINIRRTILALLYGSNLREEKDFYFTKTRRGGTNYHIRVNPHTLKLISEFMAMPFL